MEEKVCYSYNKETGLYQGEEYAQKCPVTGEWLLPCDCTFIVPQTLPQGNQELLRYNKELLLWELISNPRFIEEQRIARRNAYRDNTDDLVMKAMRLRMQGEEDKARHLELVVEDMVTKIKELFPYS